MSNFRKADNSVYQVFLELIEKTFPELSWYSFGLLFRQTIKKSRGNLILAEICHPTKLLSFFAKNEQGNPYDFLIITDEMVWACANETDRIALLRHEMRHVHIDKKGNPRMIDHDFADFHVEVELNADRPSWGRNLAEVVKAAYQQIKDGGQDPRLNRKDIPEATETIEEKPRQTQFGSGKPNLKEDYFTEDEQKGKNVPDKDSKPLVISKKHPDKPVKDATEKLQAMAEKRGLLKRAAAPATSI